MTTAAEGGCIIVRPKRLQYSGGDEIGFTLMSDPHVGAREIGRAHV